MLTRANAKFRNKGQKALEEHENTSNAFLPAGVVKVLSIENGIPPSKKC